MENYVLPYTGHSRTPEASRLGMWLFLFTELLLFGGLITVYLAYRALNPDAFMLASNELNISLGTINTVVLLTSCMTIAMAITALQKGKKKPAIYLMLATIVFALVFMLIRFFESNTNIHQGIFPYPELSGSLPPGESLFFFLYYFITGLHVLHVIAGTVFIAIITVGIGSNRVTRENISRMENSGLYWYLTVIIWIYLFPLFYLIH